MWVAGHRNDELKKVVVSCSPQIFKIEISLKIEIFYGSITES